MKMRAVLVGTGGWAKTHAQAYALCQRVELVGLCGHSNAQRLAALAEECGVGACSLDLETLLDKTEPDIVDIACNPHFRLEGVRAALRPSVKLINVEKPLALTPNDAYEIERLCREHGKRLVVNHQKKFLPAWSKAKAAIADGLLGPLDFLRASCQGNLLEQGTHLVDMTLYFHDYRPVRWVMGQIDDLQGLDKPQAAAPDAALATVCFDDGVRAMLEFGSVGRDFPGETNKWHHFSLEAYGSKGHLRISLNRTLSITTYADGKTEVSESSWSKGYVQAEVAHLDAAARYAQNPSVGHISALERSMASFDVIMAIYASGCGEGRVALPRRFDDRLMHQLQALRAQRAVP